MLILLNRTWYHYCEIGADTVDALIKADSVGRYYNAIQGHREGWTLRLSCPPGAQILIGDHVALRELSRWP